jgi:hypothetical protein
MIWDKLRLGAVAVWLMVGVGICVVQAVYPKSSWGWIDFSGMRISMGWVALLLGAYNLVRWWGARMMKAQRKQEAEQAEKAERNRPKKREEPPAAPDPTFDFSDQPPSAGEHRNGSH